MLLTSTPIAIITSVSSTSFVLLQIPWQSSTTPEISCWPHSPEKTSPCFEALMCKILKYSHTCGHSVRHLLSQCRGTYRKPKRRSTYGAVACRAEEYLNVVSPIFCGACQNALFEEEWQKRLEAGRMLRRELSNRGLDPNHTAERMLQTLEDQYRTAAWTVRERFPPMTKRKLEGPLHNQKACSTSPLRWELKAEDVLLDDEMEETEGELPALFQTFQEFYISQYGWLGPTLDGSPEEEDPENVPTKDKYSASASDSIWDSLSASESEATESWDETSVESVTTETATERDQEPTDLWDCPPICVSPELEAESGWASASPFYQYVPPVFNACVRDHSEDILKGSSATSMTPSHVPDPNWNSTCADPNSEPYAVPSNRVSWNSNASIRPKPSNATVNPDSGPEYPAHSPNGHTPGIEDLSDNFWLEQALQNPKTVLPSYTSTDYSRATEAARTNSAQNSPMFPINGETQYPSRGISADNRTSQAQPHPTHQQNGTSSRPLSPPTSALDTPIAAEAVSQDSSTQPRAGALRRKHPPTPFAYALKHNTPPADYLAAQRRMAVEVEKRSSWGRYIPGPKEGDKTQEGRGNRKSKAEVGAEMVGDETEPEMWENEKDERVERVMNIAW